MPDQRIRRALLLGPVAGQRTGSGVDQTLPTRVELDDVRDVHVGELHACAVHGSDGQVSCWGRNDAGQVGDGTVGMLRGTPVTVVGITGAVKVRTGQLHSCAVHGSDRRVRCWGDNQHGQLGDGMFDSRRDATGPDVSSLTGVVDLTVGDAVTCAVTEDGDVYCWGINGTGELGSGTVGVDEPEPTPLTTLTDATEISGGCHRHLCAISDAVWCWGDNSFGQIGTGGARGFASAPQQVNVASGHVAVGAQHTCAAGIFAVFCWGDNAWSQLGFAAAEPQTTPGRVEGLPDDSAVVDVEVGCFQSCVRRQDGSIWCWGSNDHGELGDGTTDDRIDPQPIHYECQ